MDTDIGTPVTCVCGSTDVVVTGTGTRDFGNVWQGNAAITRKVIYYRCNACEVEAEQLA